MPLTWESIDNLAERYGDSFYLLDTEAFRDNYHEFLDAFRQSYPKVNIAYSYKTNYTPALCRAVNEMGGYAEVVSDMEYDLALRIGVPPTRIVLNGPLKSEHLLRRALLAGSIVNLDAPYEVAMVEKIAQEANTLASDGDRLAVGLRCNFDVGNDYVSRFGFDAQGPDLSAAFERLERLDNCSVAGLHCHLTTPHRSVESFALRTNKMLEICASLFGDRPPRFLDLGGGILARWTLNSADSLRCLCRSMLNMRRPSPHKLQRPFLIPRVPN